jgi:chitodextrinase
MKRLALGFIALASLATLGFASLATADQLAPNAITLTVGVGKTTAVISWTAPSDQCSGAAVASYDLRYSTSAITACNFESATTISTTTPQAPGNTECFELSSLPMGTTYWFAVMSRDAAGNWSPISNIVQKTTKTTGGEVVCN